MVVRIILLFSLDHDFMVLALIVILHAPMVFTMHN